MNIMIVCSSCSQTLGVTSEALGKKVRCPLCQAVFEARSTDRGSPPTPFPGSAGSAHFSQESLVLVQPGLAEKNRPAPLHIRTAPAKTPLVLMIGLPVLGLLIAAAVVLGLVVGSNRPDRHIERNVALLEGEKKLEKEGWLLEKEKFFILRDIDPGGLNNNKIPLPAGDGVIKGQVTYDGELPEGKIIPAILRHDNKEGCLKGPESEKIDQTWLVDKKTKGVANVVVWLVPPQGKYFAVKEEDKIRREPAVIDQPHCAFVPHVVAVYPAYFDGRELVKTGQKLRIKNSTLFNHNTKWEGDGVNNKPVSILLPPKEEFRDYELNPQPDPLEISCNFHPWMSGFIWIFDHPYHAVTNSKGEFEIKNVPVGVNLTFVAWHEAKNRFFERKMSFKKGDNELELRIKE
jgi:LSD1 subclass zinc finger protein